MVMCPALDGSGKLQRSRPRSFTNHVQIAPLRDAVSIVGTCIPTYVRTYVGMQVPA